MPGCLFVVGLISLFLFPPAGIVLLLIAFFSAILAKK